MARLTKGIELRTGHTSKEEIEEKRKNEELLKGDSDKITPPVYLNSA